jgi:hypothetical protein
LKSAATGKSSQKSYGDICDLFTALETLMVDGGPVFYNKELREECAKRGKKLGICPSYSPGSTASHGGYEQNFTGSLEAYVRTRPRRGRIRYNGSSSQLARSAAIRYINDRILPNLKYSPNELLLSLVVNTKQTPTSELSREHTLAEFESSNGLRKSTADEHRTKK